MNDLKKNINLPLLYEIRKDVFAKSRDAVKEIPSEIRFYQDIQSAVSYICDGLEGEDALLYFTMILSIIRIQGGAPPNLLESLLMAYLPDDAAEKYTEYKKQYQSARQEQTPLEILLSHGPDIGEGGILVVKRLLEEKIELADVQTLKGMITEPWSAILMGVKWKLYFGN